jgi:hypothetical protein
MREVANHSGAMRPYERAASLSALVARWISSLTKTGASLRRHEVGVPLLRPPRRSPGFDPLGMSDPLRALSIRPDRP